MSDKLVMLKQYESPVDANMDKCKLEDEGIACFLKDENIGSMNFYYGGAVGNIKLIIEEENIEKARDILGEVYSQKDNYENDSKLTCPGCNSEDIKSIKPIKPANILLSLFVGLPIFSSAKHWECNACDNRWKDKRSFIISFIKYIVLGLCLSAIIVGLFNI